MGVSGESRAGDDGWERERLRLQLESQRRMQDGVLTHAQLVAAGLTRADLARMQRRNELRRVHPRVYVDHTGPLNWHQRAWAAVLYAAPAYLYGPSAEPPRTEQLARPGFVPGPIHVAIDQSRRVKTQPGIVIHRITNLESHAYGGTPPRLRLEDNALAMAHEARSDIDTVASLANVVGRSYVTPDSLRAALHRFPSLRRRAWIATIIDDLESGTHSVLEHGYLTKVERAHGLPQSDRQVPRISPSGSQFRDVEYEAYGLVVELDGALGHDTWRDQARDADRALDDLAATGAVTARLRWHQVYDSPCRTALSLVRILRSRGWAGRPVACSDSCPIGAEP
ncbi:type IV toxin-antitoxin system AbiEi family antitoxin domain-containing protein [Nocardioides luteus]|nr:type IV toxin-antitoxin system AbiEi family antitoxin domain-containing protein [Nocardioides luteus]